MLQVFDTTRMGQLIYTRHDEPLEKPSLRLNELDLLWDRIDEKGIKKVLKPAPSVGGYSSTSDLINFMLTQPAFYGGV